MLFHSISYKCYMYDTTSTYFTLCLAPGYSCNKSTDLWVCKTLENKLILLKIMSFFQFSCRLKQKAIGFSFCQNHVLSINLFFKPGDNIVHVLHANWLASPHPDSFLIWGSRQAIPYCALDQRFSSGAHIRVTGGAC